MSLFDSRVFVGIAIIAASAGCVTESVRRASMPEPRLEYPQTAKVFQSDNYHGTEVRDPYRWLEDDNAPATKAWVEAQNKVTFAYLEKLPIRHDIKRRLTDLWNF